jgi:hypothetical protein
VFAFARGMQQTWTAPRFEEVNLGSEIGTYYEDEDDPSFLFTRKTTIRRRASAVTPTRPAPTSTAPDTTDETCA